MFQFSTAVAKAWVLRDGQMSEVDLFDSGNVPALAMETDWTNSQTDYYDLPEAPALYIGKICLIYLSVEYLDICVRDNTQ